MNMNMSYVAGILVGILIAVILVKLFARKLHTNGEKKDRYDERQLVLIGKGYKYGFYGILIYNGVYTLISFGLDSSLFAPGVSECLRGTCHIRGLLHLERGVFRTEFQRQTLSDPTGCPRCDQLYRWFFLCPARYSYDRKRDPYCVYGQLHVCRSADIDTAYSSYPEAGSGQGRRRG